MYGGPSLWVLVFEHTLTHTYTRIDKRIDKHIHIHKHKHCQNKTGQGLPTT